MFEVQNIQKYKPSTLKRKPMIWNTHAWRVQE
jgi:hypothetical protein